MNKRSRAIIIENGKILLIHRIKGNDHYWVFPGGGMEEIDDDNPAATLARECKEELGVNVEVGELLCVVDENDYIEHFYMATRIDGKLGSGKGKEFLEDSHEKGKYMIEWLTREELVDKKVFPESVKKKVLGLM